VEIAEMPILKFCTFFLLFAATAVPVLAYADPNSFGLIMQFLAPLLVALAVAWNKIKQWCVALKNRILNILLSSKR
jgi:hypothetical protein